MSRWEFEKECLRYALPTSFFSALSISGMVSFIGACISYLWPGVLGWMNSLLWLIPSTCFLLLVLINIWKAPYKKYREVRQVLDDFEKSARDSFSLKDFEVIIGGQPNLLDVRLGIVFQNSGDIPIRYTLQVFELTIGNQTIENPQIEPSGARVVGGRNDIFRFPVVQGIDGTVYPLNGVIRYRLTYTTDPPEFSYERTLRVQFTFWYKHEGRREWQELDS